MKKIVGGAVLVFLFAGCSPKKEKKTGPVMPAAIGRPVTDSMAAPVVTLLTGIHTPQQVKAAKPILFPLRYPDGVGIPNFTNYSTTDGLPSNDLKDLTIDREGNLWISSWAGLCKYDGSRFTTYTTVNGLCSDFIEDKFIDRKNNIWITTFDNRISIFNGRSFSSPVLDTGSIQDGYSIITTIAEDQQGTIWLGGYRGLYQYKDSTFRKINLGDTLNNKEIRGILQDKKGNMLIQVANDIIRYDGK